MMSPYHVCQRCMAALCVCYGKLSNLGKDVRQEISKCIINQTSFAALLLDSESLMTKDREALNRGMLHF